MVNTEGEVIRDATAADKREILVLISEELAQQQSAEFGRNIKVGTVIGNVLDKSLTGSVFPPLTLVRQCCPHHFHRYSFQPSCHCCFWVCLYVHVLHQQGWFPSFAKLSSSGLVQPSSAELRFALIMVIRLTPGTKAAQPTHPPTPRESSLHHF